jgi:DNA (cytosine-5)-methyltransferase 1
MPCAWARGLGYTGSALDQPAKAIEARVYGVPGGENMLIWTTAPRAISRCEKLRACKGYRTNSMYRGAWLQCLRQIGNALPVTVTELAGR